MFHSVVPFEKPLQHFSLQDWHTRTNQQRHVADARRKDAFVQRHTARTLRNETRIESEWANYDTNEALTDRISELGRWREVISKTFERIEREIRLLQDEKANTERELEALAGPIAVIGEVLAMRDNRRGSELTYDEADFEIKNELKVLENNQLLLSDRCRAAFEKLSRLEEVRFKIHLEIENKVEAIALDTSQLALDKNVANLSYKPDSTRHPTDSCSYETWLQHVKNMKQLAENELADTYAIRESLLVAREKARNILHAQMDRAEHTIRKRIFETQRARNELEYQKLKMSHEMELAACELKALEQAHRDKSSALKLAETRLENRAQRSGMELCLDQAYNTLCLEVEKLHEINRRLMAKIDDTKTNFNLLEEQQYKIAVDLENKQHSLMTDIRALDLRTRLRGGEYGLKVANPSAQTDRNIVLTQMEKEIPKD